ncbi:MAG: hypothetical protein R2695_16660 [Acidimicrobiales bacterium]
MMTIGGHADEGYGEIADEFRRNFEERGELGGGVRRRARRPDGGRPLGWAQGQEVGFRGPVTRS